MSNTFNLASFGTMLGNALCGGNAFAGGLLASILFTVFFCLAPVTIFTAGKSMIAEMVAGVLGMGFSIAVGWLSYWFLLIIVLMIALGFAGKFRDILSGGRGGELD